MISIDRKKLLWGLLIFILIALVCFIWGANFGYDKGHRVMPSSAAAPFVTVNPAPEVKKQAEIVQKIEHVFTIKQPDLITPNTKQEIPVAVTVRDEKTGQTQEAQTVADVEKNENGDLNVTLSDEIAVDIPPPKIKTWSVGGYFSTDGWGGFVEKDFKIATIKNVDVMTYGRIEYDQEPEVQAGVLLRF